MQISSLYKIKINSQFSGSELPKGIYLVIVHAMRIPPHIGMIVNNRYHSLTIKGQELNQPAEVLLKNTRIRKIPSLFIRLKKHATFSYDYLNEHFISNIQQFNKVEVNKATCLSPVKLFFEETYGLSLDQINYIFELLPLLEEAGVIEDVSSLFIDEEMFQLPVYDLDEINKGIKTAQEEIKLIKKQY